MTDYKSLKVPELKGLLQERSLAVSGNKAELIARLEEHDRSKAPAAAPEENKPAPATSPAVSSKPAPAIAPPAEDEIDWDDEGTSAPPASAAAPASEPAKASESASASAPAPSARSSVPDAKPTLAGSAALAAIAATKKKAAAAPKAEPAAAATAAPKTEEAKPATDTDTGVAPKESTPATDASEGVKKVYAAGLAITDAMKELQLRKKRAERFNQPDTLAEINKKIEELEKSEGGSGDTKSDAAITTAIDNALPEKNFQKGKRRRGDGEEKGGDRDGKRRNVANAPGARRDGANNSDRGGRAGRGGRGGSNNQNQTQSKEAPKKSYGKVTDDPVERAKAEARAKRFGTAISK